ncbi:tape measure protein [Lactiplantibacillus pentosus]|nr:tape measure protein [Lactiplantibacillus pentosus]ASG79318.1 peptidase M23 [Lactiplantibacillus pentosus]MCC3164459.1 tape measure protein [Lactiplantibacillus pentosus]MCJ8189601.1 tape measure protein [Lactiplantibacillus pentosus]WMB62755.1 tape measure protein [Lactiplantibacillus pentosus]
MAKKVVGREMTSKVGLDSAEAVKSLKQLTAEVKANTSGWKAQETALKSAGEYQKAAAARVDGLAKSMEAQKAKIDELKSRQSGLSRNTKDGEEQYLKLTDQINKASRSYDSMGGQLDRAKSKLQYYNSGLADLQKGYKQSTALSESYVKRLEAEGRSAEANKAKLGGLKQAYSNMEAQYKAQTSELDRIKTASGATSDAYKRQQVRVNETATAMAKAKTSQRELVKAMEKEPHAFMHGVRSKLDSIDDKAKKTSHLFGTILGAHLVANGITSAFTAITSHINEAISAGMTYEKEQQKMTATWTTLTGTATKSKAMVDTINDLSVKTGQAVDVVNELEQGFYHLHSSKTESDQLTKSMLNMSDAVGLNSQQIQAVTQDMVNGLSRGKANAGMLNQISQYFPMFREQLAKYETQVSHGKKVTVADLTAMAKAGKISATDIEKTFNSLGSGKYDKAADNMLQTMVGMERTIKARVPALIGDIEKPILNAKSPIYKAVSKWVSDKDTDAEFKDVGNAVALQMKLITKAFGGKNINVTSALDKMLANVAKGIDKLGSNIIAHKKDIKSFFSSMKTASKTSFNVFVQSLKDIEPILKIVGKFAEKHPKVFAGLASSAYVASKGIAALKLAFSGLDLAKGIGGKLSRIVFKPRVDGSEGKRELTKFASFVKRSGAGMGRWLKMAARVTTSKAKSLISGLWSHTKSVGGKIGKGLKWTAKVAWKGASKSVGLLWKATKGTSKLIGKGLSWTAKIAYKGASKAFSVLGAGIKTLGKSFLSLGRLLLANPIGLVLTAVVALGAAFYEAYKHIKPFREWVNKTFKSIVNFGKGLLKWGSKAVKTVGHTVKNIRKKFDKFKSGFKKSWNKHWNAMTSKLHSAWNRSYKHTREFFSSVGKKWNGWKKSFKKSWSRHWNAMTSKLHSAWNSSYKHTKSFFSSMGKKWVGWKKSWSHSWNSHWNKMRSNLHSYWNKDLSHTRVFGKSMGHWLSTFKKSFKSGWSSLGTGVRNIFKGLWKDLKKFARDGMNDVIDLINGGINAVDAVIHTFGGKKKTIADLHHVHFAEGTGMFSGSRNPITRPTMAMLNDGSDSPRTGNKEMVMLPNGDSGIVQGRNTKMLLPAGSEVLSASETAMLMSMQGVTKYAKGTGIFGDILNSVTNGISGVTSWVGKKVKGLEKFFKTAENIIAHPIKSLENLFSWSSKGISGVMSNIGHGLFNGVEKQAKTWWSTLWGGVSDSLDSGASKSSGLLGTIKKQVGSGFWSFISKLADMFGDDGGGSIEGGAITHSMINKALKMTKVPRRYWSKMQSAIIKTADSETGNRNIMQTISDVNSASGNPAGGPLQFTKTTFDAFAFPGHHNFRSSFDQVLAFLNNSDYLHATGNTSIWGHAKYDWLHSGPQGHKRFENGGIINTNQLIEVAEHNKPEMVLPLTNKSRANQLIAQANQVVNGNNGSQIASNSSESSEKLDKVIALLTALVSGQGNVQAVIAKSDVVNAVKSNTKKTSQYSQMMGY